MPNLPSSTAHAKRPRAKQADHSRISTFPVAAWGGKNTDLKAAVLGCFFFLSFFFGFPIFLWLIRTWPAFAVRVTRAQVRLACGLFGCDGMKAYDMVEPTISKRRCWRYDLLLVLDSVQHNIGHHCSAGLTSSPPGTAMSVGYQRGSGVGKTKVKSHDIPVLWEDRFSV